MSDLNFEKKDLLNVTACCQKVLPLVYDDSLSYYEVLCKVQNKLNEMIEINNTIRDEINKEYVEILESAKTVTKGIASVTRMRDEVLTLKQATEQYSNDVVTVYNETVNARDTAVAKADLAEKSATKATEKANIAQTSATTATEKADIAQQSATTATQKANEASQYVTIANKKAEIATTSADIAKNNADKVITAMSEVSGTVNYYQTGNKNINITSSETETITATVTPKIRNNVLYMDTLIKQVLTGQQTINLPNIKAIDIDMTSVFSWAETVLPNIIKINLPIVTYFGSRSISLKSINDKFYSSASGRGTGGYKYQVQLQLFANNTDTLAIDRGGTETLYYNVTIAQPLIFKNE